MPNLKYGPKTLFEAVIVGVDAANKKPPLVFYALSQSAVIDIAREMCPEIERFIGMDIDAAKAIVHDPLTGAAADLLAVAKLILKEWEEPSDGQKIGTLIARLSQYSAEARKAIDKAEGRL